MTISTGQIYRHTTLVEGGPSMTPQVPNRFRVVAVGEDYVEMVRDGADEPPLRRDRASFEAQFELITQAPSDPA